MGFMIFITKNHYLGGKNSGRFLQGKLKVKRWLQALCDNIKLIKKYYEN